MSDKLNPGNILNKNVPLFSRDQHYKFVMQSDGNLVLYNDSGKALWASNTNGEAVSKCIMQNDGNLVIYGFNDPIWATNTVNHPGAFLIVQNDGNVVIYDGRRPIWATNTDE